MQAEEGLCFWGGDSGTIRFVKYIVCTCSSSSRWCARASLLPTAVNVWPVSCFLARSDGRGSHVLTRAPDVRCFCGDDLTHFNPLQLGHIFFAQASSSSLGSQRNHSEPPTAQGSTRSNQLRRPSGITPPGAVRLESLESRNLVKPCVRINDSCVKHPKLNGSSSPRQLRRSCSFAHRRRRPLTLPRSTSMAFSIP